MPSDTRDKIVHSARELFWRQGFQPTTLAQISEESGAKLGSIYYFFQTKSDLLYAVLEHYEERLGAWLIDPVFERTDDPEERLFGVIDTYRTFLLDTRFTRGCPVGGLAVELPEREEDARVRIAVIFDALTEALTSCALRLDLRADGPRPAAVASLVVTIIEGGIVQARATQSIEPLDDAVACLRDYIGRRRS